MIRGMRLTYALAKIAADLLNATPEQLYALSISHRTGLPNGVVVPRLHAMEIAGWVVSTWEHRSSHNESRPLRRYYVITECGQEALTALLLRVKSERRFTPLLV